ncbi:uncharacterized protein LOC106170533 [Lingula anatina]|uniref:Uncharacterized protein LOC106170533 n=1 Tax=Lingula anatina TaxID=7574 RepID=A0A1S3J7N5_LINAN|nr:uncharacterized protein LOC106170533 [Lingula anatina]|eukprot:XP_013405869.1 uncharacterized protein LOC106170533 [Lingula anatina]
MSLKTILKNIYSFLEVLRSARSPDVETWDQQALENALQWATYCEQVYTQAQCKPYREDLNQQVQQLGKLPLKLGDLEINLELLRKATPVLIKSLVQNPQLSDQLLSRILSVGNYGSSACDILSLLSELSETKSSLQQAMQLKELVNSAQQSGEIDQHWRSTSVQTQACLLLRHIRKVWINCHRRDKAVSHTEIILTSALMEEYGLGLIGVDTKKLFAARTEIKTYWKMSLKNTVLLWKQ